MDAPAPSPPPPPFTQPAAQNPAAPWKFDAQLASRPPLTAHDRKWRTSTLMVFGILTVIFTVLIFAITIFAGPPTPADPSHSSIMASLAGWAAALFAGATLLFSFLTFRKPWNDSTVKGVMLGFWALIPPLWFMVEYMYLVAPADLDHFKFRVELIMHAWTAVVVILAILFYKSLDAEV